MASEIKFLYHLEENQLFVSPQGIQCLAFSAGGAQILADKKKDTTYNFYSCNTSNALLLFQSSDVLGDFEKNRVFISKLLVG